jgi:hypothetical protein
LRRSGDWPASSAAKSFLTVGLEMRRRTYGWGVRGSGRSGKVSNKTRTKNRQQSPTGPFHSAQMKQ